MAGGAYVWQGADSAGGSGDCGEGIRVKYFHDIVYSQVDKHFFG